MEQQFNTSFIPKKSLQEDVNGTTPGKYVHRRSVHGPGFFLMLLVFITTLVSAIGVFGYTKVVQSRIKEKIIQLDRDRAAYKPEIITALKRVDARLRGAKTLVENHKAMSPLFTTLEKLTLTDVRYSEVEVQGMNDQSGTPTGVNLSLIGDARNFRSVALQMDAFTQEQAFRDPVVTKLEKAEESGEALFSIKMTIDPTMLLFTHTLNRVPVPAPSTPPATTASSTATTTSQSSEQGTTTVPAATSTPREDNNQ